MDKIDAMGGAVAAIEAGYMQEEIAGSAYEYQRKIESNDKIIVGVNKFTIEEKGDTPVFRIDDSIRMLQSEKLAALKARRNHEAVQQCLAGLEAAAKDGTNLMPIVIECVENLCTLGEIADVLRNNFGEY